MKDLKEYKKKLGDCNVSSRNTDYKSLVGWVANMRNARKGKVNSKLTVEMIDSLNGIGFYWGKGQSAELSDAEKVKFGMKSVSKKDDASTVRKRAKADASKDEEDDLPLFSMCFIIDGVHFDPEMDDIVMEEEPQVGQCKKRKRND